MTRNEDDKKIADLYNSRFGKNLKDHELVGWGSKESQDLRFKVMCEIGDLSGASILDVGCGLGDLYFYMKNAGIRDFSYHGIDLSESLVKEARSRLTGEKNAKIDLEAFGGPNSGPIYDYIFSSGAWTFKVEDNWKRTKQALKQMFERSRKGVACNFLTTHVDFEEDYNFHYEPDKMFDFCVSELTRRVTLRHDYPLYEFTIYLYKS